jgi:hypothetical protein
MVLMPILLITLRMPSVTACGVEWVARRREMNHGWMFRG